MLVQIAANLFVIIVLSNHSLSGFVNGSIGGWGAETPASLIVLLIGAEVSKLA